MARNRIHCVRHKRRNTQAGKSNRHPLTGQWQIAKNTAHQKIIGPIAHAAASVPRW